VRIIDHPILGRAEEKPLVKIEVDGEVIEALQGETIASALIAQGRYVFRHTEKTGEPRGVFCAIGRCTDCLMIVDGIPNVRTCVTPVKEGMKIETQKGLGEWKDL
jgi:predicted molibdopterin-dependent oxidoreductase YjgC